MCLQHRIIIVCISVGDLLLLLTSPVSRSCLCCCCCCCWFFISFIKKSKTVRRRKSKNKNNLEQKTAAEKINYLTYLKSHSSFFYVHFILASFFSLLQMCAFIQDVQLQQSINKKWKFHNSSSRMWQRHLNGQRTCNTFHSLLLLLFIAGQKVVHSFFLFYRTLLLHSSPYISPLLVQHLETEWTSKSQEEEGETTNNETLKKLEIFMTIKERKLEDGQ